MPGSGGARGEQGNSSNVSADDIFESPNRERNGGRHGGNGSSRKRTLSAGSNKHVDPSHQNNKLREDRSRRQTNGPKKTNSIGNGSVDDIFVEPNQQPNKSDPNQQGQKKKQTTRKKKNRTAPNEPGNNASATPSITNQSTQMKNRAKKKKHQNNATKADPADDIFAVSSQQQTNDKIIHHQPRAANNQKTTNTRKDNQGPKQTQGKKKHVKQNCYEIPASKHRESNEYKSVIEWDSPIGYVPLSEEESIVEFMFQRNGKRERGMLKDKPPFVVSKYRKAMQQRAPSMTFSQALSLRRHHIKLFNQFKDMTQLGLGKVNDINASASLFECAIEEFLKKSSIDFRTEEDQKKLAKEKNEILRATPDFILPKPILLRKVQNKSKKKGQSNEKKAVIEERTIHWIEAKMYYGASTIPHGSRGAVGTVLKKAKSYVETFGEGALLFMMGCGEKLAAELNDIGVSVLDCSGNTVSLDRIHDHQRTWCANEKGQILP